MTGQVHRKTEDFVNVVGDIMYPKKTFDPFAYNSDGSILYSRVTSLGYLTSSLRKKHALEMWSPYEVAIFEASMTLYGKNFHKIHKQVRLLANTSICAYPFS